MKKKKIAVAMSGGVDSSLSAALLKNQGYEVIGVTMQLESENFHERSCCSSKEIEDATLVAEQLGIKIHVVDFREEFRKRVINYFVAEYLNGRTPNPCVICNKKIKFGTLLDFATEIGADYLATGHYARIIFEDGRFKLKKAIDLKKDQSYVLYNLTPEKISKIILPLGEFSKTQTRELAEKLNLPVAHKKDSQEICFVPDDDYKAFLQKFAPNSNAFNCGEIIDTDGNVLGHHNGFACYTIGQRKGLGISSDKPLYVTKIDTQNNKVIVGSNDKIFSKNLSANNINWIYKPNFNKIYDAKIRYGFKTAKCIINEQENYLHVEFLESQRAITPGQSIVFYDDDELIGGGIIENGGF